MINMRTILHCDCNAFYASVETALNPELKNVPMAVGGNPEARHGIILAKNEAAKKYGVVTAETIWSARKKCPEIVIVPPHHDLYEEYSIRVNDIYKEYTEFVEPFGIDESWLDVTDVRELFGDGEKIANELRERVRREVGLTISVGVSFTKAFAKLGSDYKKPDATTVIMPEDVEKTVYPEKLNTLLFAGRKTCEEFKKYGIITIGDLAKSDESFILNKFGKNGHLLYKYANGTDGERVRSIYENEDVKSIGNSYTFPHDLVGEEEIRTAAVWLADTVSSRLRRAGVKCGGVAVVIKDENLKSITRQKALDRATDHAADLAKCAMELVKKCRSLSRPVRMLGITAMNLSSGGTGQVSLFDTGKSEKNEKLDAAMDSVRKKYGKNALKFASSTQFDTEAAKDDDNGEGD